MNVVDVEKLTKVYQPRMRKGGIVALDEVSLSIEQREVFGLLGPNGAGKTTLFKVLLSICRPTSGSAMIHGLPPADPRSRRKVGFLPENHRFPEHLTGRGLIALTGRFHGMTRVQIEERSDYLLDLVDMAKWGDTLIRKYSKGMAQRIGLAQAMVANPDLLLLDEPTDGVDPVGKVELRKVFQRVRDEGKTVVLNSHLLSEVESVADRVAILQRGKVVKVGSVEELTSRRSQYEIEAEIGNRLFDIPEDIGKRVSVSSNRLIVELNDSENVNWVIDAMRAKRISIRSVKPMKLTLEQSFVEAVTEPQEKGV